MSIKTFAPHTWLAIIILAGATVAQVPEETAKTSENWPQFRGYRARGIAEGFETARSWDVAKGEGVAWRTAVPGLAHASPVVWGDRIFVTTAVLKKGKARLSSLYGSRGYGAGESVTDESEHLYQVFCLDRKSGKILWKRTAHEGVPRVKRHPKSSHANPTPACDARHVVAFFGSEGLYCYDHAGELLWKRDFGVLNSGAPGYKDKDGFQWGFASSPVIHGDRVLVQCDHEGQSFITAVSLKDGKDLWRTAREEDSTWSSPTVHEKAAANRSQVIVNGYKHIGGYDLETGKEIWNLAGGGDVPVPTPVVAHDLIFLTSSHGRSRPVRAIRVDARGRLGSDPEKEQYLAWVHPRRGVYMQTPLVYQELLYCCSDGGILSCYEARTGEFVYRERVGAGRTGFSGSPVAAAGKVYLSGESGQVFVVKAGRSFEVLATNDMGETCMATPAISEGTLYFRTRHHVIAVHANKKPAMRKR